MAGMYGCFKGRNSDSVAMASGIPDVTANQEPAEVQEECSGKKKSKFQTFKRFFARKKRKDPSTAGADASLKASQSSDNVSKASESNTLTRAEKDKGSGSKISLGGKALSHDSVFVSDSSEANEALGASQDSIHGKVKSLQLQLKQAIKLGSPPSLMCVKRAEDPATMSEDDGLPCSPPEYTTVHTNQAQANSSISLEGIDSDEDRLSCAASSRAVSPLVVPGDFSQPASPFVCLDNSAAKHKLALRQKARRRPASRPEEKAGQVSEVEAKLTASTPLQDQQEAEVTGALLKPEVEREENETEEEEESEEKDQPQHSMQSLLGDEEEREEGEDESEAEQDVSHGPDTSCPPEPSHSEEEDSDSQPLPSSKMSSSASSLDSPRATPEPPSGLTDTSMASGAAESKDVSDSASDGEEDGVHNQREEENSFLQEVLSSLKTPLVSSSLDMKTEGVVLEVKEEEVEEKEEEEVEMDREEVKEEEEEVDEFLSSQAAPSCSMLSDQTTKEEEQVVTSLWQEEGGGGVDAEEEIKGGGEEAEEETEEEEEPVVERFIRSDDEDEEEGEEQAVEVKPEEDDSVLSCQTISQAGDDNVEEEDGESEGGGKEEAIKLEKKSEMEEEEGWEMRGEDEEVEVTERTEVEEAEEAMEIEESSAEDMLPDMLGEEVHVVAQEADEGVMLEGDAMCAVKLTDDDQIPAETSGQGLTAEQKEQDFNQNSGDETEEGEETVEEGADLSVGLDQMDREEGVEASQTDADQSKRVLELESVEPTAHSDTKQMEEGPSEAAEQDDGSPEPSPLSLLHHEPQSPKGEARSPTKTSTAIVHINLVSPSSEKATSLFQLPPAAADSSDSASEAASHDTESTSADKEEADAVEEEEEEQETQSTWDQDAAPPAPVEEKTSQPPCSPNQSKVRFTITPAWQRSQSLNPPPSPPASVSSPSAVAPSSCEEPETLTEDSVTKAEPATSPKVELVLSPSRVKTAKPQSSVTPAPPKISTSASIEESSVIVEGNPDNPFGVRLRKTSALLRFNSEEENTEPPTESQTQPASSKVDSPQPVSVKPSICPPVSNKPALPKKPDAHSDSGGKLKRVSDSVAGRAVSAGSDPPSWISVAKQKQKIYKENSLEEITVKKEDQERKSSLPTYVCSAASKEQGTKTAESKGKGGHLEMTKPPVSPDKEARRPFSPPTPVPPQPLKSQPLPCVAPKPYVPPSIAKYPPQPNPPQRSLSTPDAPKSPATPSSPSKTPPPLTCPQFSSRTASEKPILRAPGLSGQTPPSQQPPTALSQDEPPWMALAKKKAKAWSEMPQIVQ